MYKVKNSSAPKHICDIFYKQSKSYIYLRSNDFPISRFNCVKYGKHSIRYLGPYLWGKVNPKLRCKPNLQSFRKAVRKLNIMGMLYGACLCKAWPS